MILRTGILALLTGAIAPALATAQEPRPSWAWPEVEPAKVGLDRSILDGLDAQIRAGRLGYVDGLLVIRHGQIAFERKYAHNYDSLYASEARAFSSSSNHDPTGPYNYFNPWWHPYYRGGDLHTMQSITKAITSIVIGVAVGRGEFPSLDTPVITFFDSTSILHLDDRKRRLTIRHLQTMTAGLDWDESGPADDVGAMESSTDWVRFAIDRPMSHEPGMQYNYNSGATQLLSYIFRRATGSDIEEYAARQLFLPLDIREWFWKRTPTGLADTEGGLYLTMRDVAKLAQLYLQNGTWQGQRIVPASWVQETLSPRIALPDRGDATGVKGGYNILLFPYGHDGSKYAFSKSGYGGQHLIGVPELGLVVVYTGWTIPRRGLTSRIALDMVLKAVLADSGGLVDRMGHRW